MKRHSACNGRLAALCFERMRVGIGIVVGINNALVSRRSSALLLLGPLCSAVTLDAQTKWDGGYVGRA